MRTLMALVVVTVACVPSTSPDKGRYSCATGAECGDGFECRPQFAGPGRCYKLGECVNTELCNGTDDNCDGRVDESFPSEDAGCQTTKLGACTAGVTTCTAGSLTCAQTVTPVAERCNQLDDDCDGVVDNGFDLPTDPTNCGSCGHVCGGGTSCKASLCTEANCEDGLDNDSNGLSDCADPSCLTLECQAMPAPAWHCSVDAGVPGCFGP
jgi:hypothetical protein